MVSISSSAITCKSFVLKSGYVVKFSDDIFNRIKNFGFTLKGELESIALADGTVLGNRETARYPKITNNKDGTSSVTGWYSETRFINYDGIKLLPTKKCLDITTNGDISLYVLPKDASEEYIIPTDQITTCDNNLNVAISYDPASKQIACGRLTDEQCTNLAQRKNIYYAAATEKSALAVSNLNSFNKGCPTGGTNNVFQNDLDYLVDVKIN